MNGTFYAALVAAILAFVWSLVRVAMVSEPPSRKQASDEWYVVDASEADLRQAGIGGERPTIGGVPLLPRVVGGSPYGYSGAGAGSVWRQPSPSDRPIVWVLPSREIGSRYLQDELARLKRMGAIRNYYRVVAHPGEDVDYRA